VKFRKLIAEFKLKAPSRGRGKARLPFDIAVYWERHYAETGKQTGSVEIYAGRKKYAEWKEYSKGMSLDEGFAEYDELAVNPEGSGMKWDRKYGPVRFLIEWEDYVDSFNKKAHSKGVDAQQMKRKPNEEHVTQMKAQIDQGHESLKSQYFDGIGGAARESSLLGRGMFHTESSSVPGVPSPAKAGRPDLLGVKEEDGSVHPPPNKKAKKFEAAACTKKFDALTTTWELNKKKFLEAESRVKEGFAVCEEFKGDRTFENYLKILQTRWSMAQVILVPASTKDAVQAAFDKIPEGDRRFLQFQVAADFILMVEVQMALDMILACSTVDDMIDSEKQAKANMNAVLQVYGQLNQSMHDITAAKSHRQKRQHMAVDKKEKDEQKAVDKQEKHKDKLRLLELKTSEKEAIKAAKSGKAVPTLFDLEDTMLADPMAMFEKSPPAGFAGEAPFMIKDISGMRAIIDEKTAQKAYDAFVQDRMRR
jgi:hypothetical protein